MHYLKPALIAVLSTCAVNSSWAVTDRDVQVAVESEIKEVLPNKGPGGAAVAVRIDGRTIFFNYGTANASGKPITSDSVFNLASLGKTFDTTLLSMAVKQGELSLDDPVVKYITELQRGRDIHKVTLGQLVTYTSGLTLPQDRAPWPETNYTLPKFLRYLTNWKIDKKYPPGQFRYSHAVYMLLHVAMERRFAKPYAALLDERLIRPLGLSSTILPLHKNDVAQLPKELLSRAVQNFDEIGNPVGKVGNVQGFYYWPGTGQMFSTARDMSVFLSAQLGEISNPPWLREAVELAHQPVPAEVDPEDPIQHKTAQAWEVRDETVRLVDKNGALDNTSSYIGLVPEKHLGIVIMTNRGDQYVAKVGRRILLRLSLPESVATQKMQELDEQEE